MGTQTVGDKATKGINALHEQPCKLRKQNEIKKQSNSISKVTWTRWLNATEFLLFFSLRLLLRTALYRRLDEKK